MDSDAVEVAGSLAAFVDSVKDVGKEEDCCQEASYLLLKSKERLGGKRCQRIWFFRLRWS